MPFCAAPLLISTVTAMLLLLKGQLAWIQPESPPQPAVPPATGRGAFLGWDSVLEIAKHDSDAQVREWKDIAALDVRPAQSLIRIRARNRHEIQIDATTGRVLARGTRLTGLLIALHEGSWFGEGIKYGVFLPATALLLLLWVTGVYLLVAPWLRIIPRPSRRHPEPARAPLTEHA